MEELYICCETCKYYYENPDQTDCECSKRGCIPKEIYHKHFDKAEPNCPYHELIEE